MIVCVYECISVYILMCVSRLLMLINHVNNVNKFAIIHVLAYK